MPRGVPYRVQLAGGGTRTYTFTEIADGTGLSLALVSRIIRGQWPMSSYAQDRLRAFFGIRDAEPCNLNVSTPQPRVRGRVVYRTRPGSNYRPPFRDRDTALRELEALESESWPPCQSGAHE